MTEPQPARPGHSRETMTDAIRTADNYHNWVWSALAPHLRPGSAVEVGSGHGRFSRRLAAQLDRVIVTDIDPVAIEQIKSDLSSLENIEYKVMNAIDGHAFDEPVDNVVLINLLEHIEDDAAMIASARDLLAPNGRLLLFVPAFPMLYSQMDEDAGHYRRYRVSELTQLVESQGLVVDRSRYFNMVGFFGWLLNRFLKSKVNSRSTNLQVAMYNRLIPLFRLLDAFRLPLGQSLVLVATKRGA